MWLFQQIPNDEEPNDKKLDLEGVWEGGGEEIQRPHKTEWKRTDIHESLTWTPPKKLTQHNPKCCKREETIKDNNWTRIVKQNDPRKWTLPTPIWKNEWEIQPHEDGGENNPIWRSINWIPRI